VRQTEVDIAGLKLPFYSVHTLVVGSGAASLNAADQLVQRGVEDVLIVTQRLGGGASKNSGSDKQTYYKLALAGTVPDSPTELAKTLWNGGCMHGDIALVEATCSAQCFYNLVRLGVPFPHTRYGGFVGYKTDHDPLQRATSAGPRTSQQMVDRLLREVRRKGIPILDEHEVVALLTEGAGEDKKVIGAIAIHATEVDRENFGLVVFNCANLVWGVGGPGGLYRASVYPADQSGAIGVALAIGAPAHNLTESQFGLASIRFRWNVSGTYQQVIPTYVSTDQAGDDAREFLNPYFPSMGKLATAIFLKGYQWPFDPRNIPHHGSSLIDVLVYYERVARGRRVWLDFRQNPSGDGRLEDFRFELLEPEAYTYLENSGAFQATPIERLEHINPLAVQLYRDNGIDLHAEPLEIDVCAQHNNGGLIGNHWWESPIRHFFPVGEVNGTHGVYRPGGAALNSGQVGSLRAAQYIAAKYPSGEPEVEPFLASAEEQVAAQVSRCRALAARLDPNSTAVEDIRAEFQARMSLYGAHIRNPATIDQVIEEAYALWRRVQAGVSIRERGEILAALRNEQLCLSHLAYLESIREYLRRGGGSRGSYLVLDPDGEPIHDLLPADWRYRPEHEALREEILETRWNGERLEWRWVPRRPIPEDDFWFENVWAEYRVGRAFE